MGFLHQMGAGVDKDTTLASEYYQRAADTEDVQVAHTATRLRLCRACSILGLVIARVLASRQTRRRR